MNGYKAFARRAFIAVAIAAGFAALLFLLWKVAQVLLLAFLGLLMAIFWRTAGNFVARHSGMPPGAAFALAVFATFLLLGVALWLFGPPLFAGLNALATELPHALGRAEELLAQEEWGRRLLEGGSERLIALASSTFQQLAGVFSTALGGVVTLLLILVTGIYLGAEPGLYLDGLVSLWPPSGRGRLRQVMAELRHALFWWLVARLSSMGVVGLLTWVGLRWLEFPLAEPLAFIAALLSFIPNLGPILALIPAILTGFTISFEATLWVLILYLAVQAVETYLVTPLIERKTVALPPALIITVQLIFGVLFGLAGLLVSTPIALCGVVLVKMLYVRDLLGEPTELP